MIDYSELLTLEEQVAQLNKRIHQWALQSWDVEISYRALMAANESEEADNFQRQQSALDSSISAGRRMLAALVAGVAD